MLSVRRFPPPTSRIYQLHYIGAETREEGGTRCQRALAAEGDRGAEEIGQQEEVETASGCPKRWCWSNGRAGGTEGSLPCSWDEEGWLPSERERRSRRLSLPITPLASLRSHGSRPRPTCHIPLSPLAGRGVLPRLRSTPPLPLSRGEPVRAAAAYLGVRTDEAREKETEG